MQAVTPLSPSLIQSWQAQDELRDHRDSALWVGNSHTLDLSALGA